MKTVKVRRVGNSNVVTLPVDLERLGFRAGEEVGVQALPSGAVMLLPSAKLHEYIRRAALQVAEESREALQLLAAYDKGQAALNSDGKLVDVEHAD